jgi:hypothetical protein
MYIPDFTVDISSIDGISVHSVLHYGLSADMTNVS